MQPVESGNVTVMVSELDKSIDFYTQTLGLVLKANYGGHYAEVTGPGITIGLHPGGKANRTNESLSIGFSVRDFDQWVSGLEEKGVVPNLKPDGWSRIAYFADPDGNPLYLIEAKECVADKTEPR